MANRSLGSLTLDLIAKVGGFTSGMNEAERSAKKSLTAIEKQAYNFGQSIGKSFRNIAALGTGALGIGSAIEGIQTALEALNNLDRLDEISAKTGISTEELSKLGYAAKLTGTDLEDLNGAFDKLAKNAVKALDPSSKQAEIFAALGVEVQDANGKLKTTDDLIKDVATAFKQLNDDTLEAAAAQELFGKSGAGLLEFLNLGADGLDQMGKKATELGAVFDEETTKAAAELKDEFDNLKTVITGLMIDVLRPLLPLLKDVTLDLQETGKAAAGAGGSAQNAGEDIAELFTTIKTLGSGTITVLEGMREVLNGLQDQATGYTNLVLGRAGALKQIADSGNRIAGAFDKPQPSLPLASGDFGFQVPSVLGGPSDFRATDPQFSVIPKGAVADAKALAKAVSGVTEAKDKNAKKTKELTEAEKAWRDIMEVNDIIDEEARKTQEQLRRDRQDREEDFQRLIGDIQTQNDLLGKTAEQQDLINTARQYGIDLSSEQGEILADTLADLYANMAIIEDQVTAMDGLRDGFKGFLNDLKDGVSLTDSLKNAFDSILDTVFQIVAQNLAESLFGQSGTTGGGASGDFFSSIFGALFGARATGGSVNSGGMYRVNEQGPELLTVGNRDYLMMGKGSGMVSPAVGGGVTINNSYINPQLNDWRSESQRRVEEATQLRVASSRNG